MNLSEIKNAVRRHDEIVSAINAQIGRIDPDLKENAQNTRRAEIYRQYSVELSQLSILMTQAMDWLHERRVDMSDPVLSLARAALEQAENACVGHGIFVGTLTMYSPVQLIALLSANWPASVIAAIAGELKRRVDVEQDLPLRRRMHESLIEKAAKFIKAREVAEIAQVQLAIIASKITFGAYNLNKDKMEAITAVEKMTLGRAKVELEDLVQRSLSDHSRRVVAGNV